MHPSRLEHLLLKFLDNTISKDELTELLSEIQVSNDSSIEDSIDELIKKNPLINQLPKSFDKETILARTKAELRKTANDSKPNKVNKTIYKKLLAVAATIIIIISIGIPLSRYATKSSLIDNLHNDIILPHHNQTTLTLQDGRTYNLESKESALLEDVIEVLKDPSGEITFKIKEGDNVNHKNTFNTPKGTSSHLILSDGTHVWLNSGSKITYPTKFDDQIRKVSIEGEAYFDVTHNSERPFIVSANNTVISVLGTQFNVATNLKPGQVFTTLVEGSVEVNTPESSFKLKPGIQAVSNIRSGNITSYSVDVNEAIAWKAGYFSFNDENIYSVLDKISTWYDIADYTVQSETLDKFTGSIIRTKNLSDLFNQLEKISTYKFEIRNRRVLVMK